jgi:hypothetical protein
MAECLANTKYKNTRYYDSFINQHPWTIFLLNHSTIINVVFNSVPVP